MSTLKSSHCPTVKTHQGFTLVELVVVIAIIGILTALAVPSWGSMMARNAVRNAANTLVNDIHLARSEAIARRATVSICPSSNGTTCDTNTTYANGWIMLAGNDATPIKAVPANLAIRADVTTRAAANRTLAFLPNGLPVAAFAGVTFQVCPTSAAHANQTRQFAISRAGRITTDTVACTLP